MASDPKDGIERGIVSVLDPIYAVSVRGLLNLECLFTHEKPGQCRSKPDDFQSAEGTLQSTEGDEGTGFYPEGGVYYTE